MNIKQLITTKSKEEVAFIFKLGCYQCHHFCQNKWGNWNCESPWHEEFCRGEWEYFLRNELE